MLIKFYKKKIVRHLSFEVNTNGMRRVSNTLSDN